jgi:uncharacterized protein YfaS (alpha-2-macroglobulin family)
MIKKIFFLSLSLLLLFSGCRIGKNAVTIKEVSPLDDVSRRTNFTITFSRNAVESDEINKWHEDNNITFSPPIKGKYEWITQKELRFYPEEILLPSTEYVLVVSPKIIGIEGLYLAGKNKFTFETSTLKIEQADVDYKIEEKKAAVRIMLNLKFNYEVSPAELKERLTFRVDKGPSLKFDFDKTEPSYILVAISEPVELTKSDRYLNITIDKGLKPIGGKKHLEKNYERRIKLPKKKQIVIESVYPEREGYTNWLNIKFSTAVFSRELKKYLTITPKVDYQISGSGQYISLKGDFKAGKTYDVLIRKGLPAMNGTTLQREFSKHLIMGNIEPYFNFVTEGMYLPKKGKLNVGIESVNMNKLELSIEKVYINNLVYFLNTNSRPRHYYNTYNLHYLGKEIQVKEFEPGGEENEKIITTIDMSDYLTEEKKGIYIIQLWKPYNRWDKKVKWVIVTDLGIMVKKSENDLGVYINSLTDLSPVPNAEVSLLSRNNQTILKGNTDPNGKIFFKDYKDKIEKFKPFVITVRKGEDFSFLEFNESRINMGDFDISGRPPVIKGYEAFLYTDRGVYRPGDTLHLASIIRDEEQNIPDAFPVTVEIIDPKGQKFQTLKGLTHSYGADEFSVPIPFYAKTGQYTARLLVASEEEIGRVRFNVEEFMPSRIKVEMDLNKAIFHSSDNVKATIHGTMLFGPPAADRKVEVKGWLNASEIKFSGYSEYTFSDSEKEMSEISFDLGETKLDSEGKAEFNYLIPNDLNPPSYIIGTIQATVFEMGGRALSTKRTFPVHSYEFYIGMKREGEGYPKRDEKLQIKYVLLSPEGKNIAGRNLKLEVFKVGWNSVLGRDSRGYYRYKSHRYLDLIEERNVEYNGSISVLTITPKNYGKHLVKLTDPETDVSSSIEFYISGWGYAPWAMTKPDRLELKLDKKTYNAGEEAKIQVQAPFPGKLFLFIEREKVLKEIMLDMAENTATISIPILDEYKPNVYISATLIRSNKGIEPHAPLRAFGVTPLIVRPRKNRLSLEIYSPDKIKPDQEISVTVKAPNASSNAYLTLAAVDEGICILTDFKTPNPFDFFYGRRRLAIETFDIYSFILPELKKSIGGSSTGGGFAEEEAKSRLMPVQVRRVKSVALWSGIIQLRRGRAKIKFKIPQFQGTLRLMAVAHDKNRFGSEEKRVIVADPIVVTPTFPRFLSGKDKFSVPITVYNSTDKAGKINVSLSADGPVKIVSKNNISETFKAKEEKLFNFQCEAENTAGKVHFKVDALGMGEKSYAEVDLPIRPPSPLVHEFGSGKLEMGKETVIKATSGWLEGTAKLELIISPFPTINLGKGIEFLLGYPHGCIEQTTSKVFPLLYFSDIAKTINPEFFKDKSSNYYVNEGIAKLCRMQLGNGGFSYWPGGDRECKWGSIYASHFLVEAKKAGFEIPDYVLNRIESRLKRFLTEEESRNRWYREAWSFERKAYAVYVLALMGRPEKSSMNYLKDSKLGKLSTYGQFLLAGAFALTGDIEKANNMIPIDIAPSGEGRETGGNFNSGTKANAIMLEMLAEIDPSHPSIPILAKEIIEKLSKRRYYSTQETAFGFMALGKALRNVEDPDYKGSVSIGGKHAASFSEKDFHIQKDDIEGKEVKIAIDGKGLAYYYWKISGIKIDGTYDEQDRGLSVRRKYLDKNGDAANQTDFRQGDLVVAEITMQALTDDLENVIITDMLPGGFEIENPRLSSSEALPWINASKQFSPEYMDIRDDRINLYYHFLNRRKKYTFYYLMRTVTRGEFALPPVAAEAMYDPAKFSLANSGGVIVK